jgi:hypothetical protein
VSAGKQIVVPVVRDDDLIEPGQVTPVEHVGPHRCEPGRRHP